MQKAVTLCRLLEPIAAAHGAHVALTGGCLYKDGERKDCDIMLYRHKRAVPINLDGFFAVAGLEVYEPHKWLTKCKLASGERIDVFHLEDHRNDAPDHEYVAK